METERRFTIEEVLAEFEGVLAEAFRQFWLGKEAAQLSLAEDLRTRLETLPMSGSDTSPMAKGQVMHQVDGHRRSAGLLYAHGNTSADKLACRKSEEEEGCTR